jgi:hypothetical protein
MIIAAQSADGITIDPALLAFIPIVTVLLTIFAGLIGAAIQGRREHARWLRDRRLDAFIAARVFVGQLERIISELKGMHDENGKIIIDEARGFSLERANQLRDEARALELRSPEVTVTFDLLGSGTVEDSINAVLKAVEKDDAEQLKRAKLAFLKDARALLAIRESWWSKGRRWWRKRRAARASPRRAGESAEG